MTIAEKKLQIENQVIAILQEQPDLFLVQTKIDAKNNIKVFLDGDNGISIGQCTVTNRALYPFIEEQKFFPNDDFSLEVSSAGIDEPLLLERQFIKNINREIAITNNEGIPQIGTLVAANAILLTLKVTEGKGKKAIITDVEIKMSDIKTAIVQIKF